MHIIKRALQLTRKFYLPPLLQIIIDPTSVCNLKCSHCSRREFEFPEKHLDIDLFKKALLPSVRRVVFQASGEPFCNPDIYRLIDLCGNRLVTLTTNGINADLDRIKKYKNVTLTLSHYGSEQYIIAKECERLGIKVTNQALLIPGREMKDDVKNQRYIHPICYFDGIKHYDDIGCWEEVRKRLVGKAQVPPLNPTRELCIDPWFSARIMMNGDVYPCTHSVMPDNYRERFLTHTTTVPAKNYIMGNLNDNPLDEIRRNAKYQGLRNYLQRVEKREIITNDELVERRKCNTDGFNYCSICLFRWGKAC